MRNFVIIPKIDPLKANIEEFREYYDRFVVLVIVFLFYLYLLTVLWNTGSRFNIIALLAPAFSILFYYIEILTEHAKRNWSIGIRAPWTLSSDRVWEKTHKIGGKLFKVAPVILVVISTIIYSYLEYKKEQK